VICECIRCAASHRDGSKWSVLRVIEREGQRPRVYVRCDVCGSEWGSSTPDAIKAGEAFLEAGGHEPMAEPPAVVVPAPTLFGGTLPQQSHGFVKVGSNLRGRSAQSVVDAIRRSGKGRS
jgi:hypothetical protein